MRKYNPEQLSRILSTSAAGLLGPPGEYAVRPTACIEQAAFATFAGDIHDDERFDADNIDAWDLRVGWDMDMDTLRVLAWLEEKGMA